MAETGTKTTFRFALALFVALVGPLASFSTSATSPCPKPDGCIDDASASFLLSLEVIERKCSAIDPQNASVYREYVQRALHGEDSRFIEKLRSSEVYARVKVEVEGTVAKMDERSVLHACKALR